MDRSPEKDKKADLAPDGVVTHHRVFIALAAFFFIYLVVEGLILLPAIVILFGWF